MTEKLLHFIWKFQYFNRTHLQTVSGEPVSVLFAGTHNYHQGPDFLNAKIKIGQTVLAGSVELHVVASDWEKHRHSTDENYNNVILHVVYQSDVHSNNNIPVLELQPHISALMLASYNNLLQTPESLACAASLPFIKELTWISWKERLLAERLSRKADNFLKSVYATGKHWEEAFWWLIARNFGIKVNADVFEAIARSIPLTVIAKHKFQLIQLEALLFGQANLLHDEFTDDYPKQLYKEYLFLKAKYGLQPVLFPVHFLRMRPSNFPTIRLAQLAMLLYKSTHLFAQIVEEKDLNKIKDLMNVEASPYWQQHYRFDEKAAFSLKKTGEQMLNNILINTIAPALFAYGSYHNNEALKEKAATWLLASKPESNTLINGFEKLGVSNSSAFDSQALIELKTEYCTKKRCLDCSIGTAILKQVG